MPKSKQAERLIKALDRIIALNLEDGKKLSYSAIAKDISESPQTFTDIKAGKKDVSISLIQTLCNKFFINQEFILNGKGHIFPEKTERIFESLKNQNKSDMTEGLMDLIKTVSQLSEANNRLTKENAEANEMIRDYLKLNNVRTKQG